MQQRHSHAGPLGTLAGTDEYNAFPALRSAPPDDSGTCAAFKKVIEQPAEFLMATGRQSDTFLVMAPPARRGVADVVERNLSPGFCNEIPVGAREAPQNFGSLRGDRQQARP